jgi:hypothetical protein
MQFIALLRDAFLNPWALAGMAILALPILIHLINLLRHKRVAWAAMEFLLVSQKKHSTWIRLKELLLLLLRMAAVAAVVLLAAQPVMPGQWAGLFGGAKTHHIVLLDDSFSTSDRFNDTDAFGEAKRFLEKLAAQAARSSEAQTVTLLRFSRVGRGTQPDMLEERVGADFVRTMSDLLANLQPSQTAAGPAAALEAIDQLLGEATDEGRIVYLVSDFRAREWRDPASLAQRLARLSASRVDLRMVHTVDAARPNLAVTALRPAVGTRAAGVPLFMELAVTNYSAVPSREVAVLLSEDGDPRPAETFDQIAPYKTELRRFQVQFPTAGEHVVAARIEGDNVAADNGRWSVVTLQLEVPVLLVDGGPEAADGRIVAAALAPGGPARTGIAPTVEAPAFLNNHPLDKYFAIYVLNVQRLDAPAVEALEGYARAGGGVAFFVGERTDARFVNESLHRDGQGLFPVPLVAQTELLVDRLATGADLEVGDHPMFRVFAGERNSFLNMVKVERYFSVPRTWKLPPESPTRLIARLRNGAPLALDHAFGDGRVVAFLTTASPDWNNWARNPSFVVAALELQSYLGAPRFVDEGRLVGTPLELRLKASDYQPRVEFSPPEGQGDGPVPFDAAATPAGLVAALADTPTAGVYQAALRPTTGEQKEVRRFAYNVQPEEGDLATVTGEHLAAALPGVRFEYQQAGDFVPTGARQQAGFGLSDAVLYLLLLLLVGEQLLAWSASYHPAPGGAR